MPLSRLELIERADERGSLKRPKSAQFRFNSGRARGVEPNWPTFAARIWSGRAKHAGRDRFTLTAQTGAINQWQARLSSVLWIHPVAPAS